MATGDLTQLATALLWIGQQSDDGTVARVITAVSAQVETFLGYRILQQSYTRTFNGVGGRVLALPDRNVSAVASLQIDGQTVPASSSVTVDGFVFDDKTIYLRGGYVFSRGVQNVTASYTAGWAAVPGDIEQACLDWVKLVHDNLDTLPGLKSIKAGGKTLTYGDNITDLGSIKLPMPSEIAVALIPRRRVAPA